VRRAAKVDANQGEIVDALRRAGVWVQCLHMVGGGVADLLAARNGRLFLIEIKDGAKPPSERNLTPAQVAWHGVLALYGVRVSIALSVEDAFRAVGLLPSPKPETDDFYFTGPTGRRRARA